MSEQLLTDDELKAVLIALGFNPPRFSHRMVCRAIEQAVLKKLTRKSYINMGAQALAAELIEAVNKDILGDGIDISAGLFGPHTTAFLRVVAEDYLAQPPKPSTCPGVPRAGCNYLATCGSVCNKCGKLHAPKGGNF